MKQKLENLLEAARDMRDDGFKAPKITVQLETPGLHVPTDVLIFLQQHEVNFTMSREVIPGTQNLYCLTLSLEL